MRTERRLSAAGIALAALAASASRAGESRVPGYAIIILDGGGIPSRWISAQPDRCPSLRELAREGVTFLRVATDAVDHRAALGRFLGAGGEGLFARAGERAPADRIWFLAPNPAFDGLAAGARRAAFGFQEEALRKLAEAYGLPPEPLGEDELAEIAKVRAALGDAVPPGEEEKALALSGHAIPRNPDVVVLDRLSRLARDARVSFAVAALLDADRAHRDAQRGRESIAATDRALGELWRLLLEEPYRNNTVFAYISLLGRSKEIGSSDHKEPTETYAVLCAPALAKGIVAADQVKIDNLRSLLLWALSPQPGTEAPQIEGVPAAAFRPGR